MTSKSRASWDNFVPPSTVAVTFCASCAITPASGSSDTMVCSVQTSGMKEWPEPTKRTFGALRMICANSASEVGVRMACGWQVWPSDQLFQVNCPSPACIRACSPAVVCGATALPQPLSVLATPPKAMVLTAAPVFFRKARRLGLFGLSMFTGFMACLPS